MAIIAGKIRKESERTMTTQYQPGFNLKIRYLTTAELIKIEEQARKSEWDRRSRQRTEEIDRSKLSRLLAEHVVLGWELDGETLRSLIDLEDYPEGDIPYSQEDCAALLENNLDLYSYIRQISHDLSLFEATRKAEARKNSSSSPGNNSTLDPANDP